MGKRFKKTCPHPEKKGFLSRGDAQRFMWKVRNANKAPYLPTRAYKCGCGKWHLTSRDPRMNPS